MSKPVILFVFTKCHGMGCFSTNLTHVQPFVKRSCSKCYGMACFGAYLTHVQTCDNIRVQMYSLLGTKSLKRTSVHPCILHETAAEVSKRFGIVFNQQTRSQVVLHTPPWNRFDSANFFQLYFFSPKDVSSQGSSEDCWRISHHTYPTHIHHTTHIPHISIQNVSHQHVSHQYVSMLCVSIQNVCISRFCNTYPTNTYPTNTYPFNTYPTNTYPCYAYPFNAYPFNAYPFKRCASAGIANVSHQYISHQYVSSTRIPPVRIHSMRIHSKSLHQQEWQWVWVSLHIISYHCYSAGMVMNIETLLFLQFLCKIINWI